MRIVVVFHSVCGNTYLMAKTFYDSLSGEGQEVSLLRVRDDSWEWQTDVPDESRQVLEQMQSVPLVTPEDILEADLVVLGSPTYFGNVSAQMKTFMDETAKFWFHARYAGKKMGAFTSAGNPEGGGDLCLQALHTYAKYMGMLSVPVPVNLVEGMNIPVYGIIHYSYASYAKSLDERLVYAINRYSEVLLSHVG